jgi:TRAP-type C4-dicarboxylate transport system substrate-binding protein
MFCAPAFGKKYVFTYSSFFPSTHIQSKLAEAWCKEVEKRTGGEVKIYFYPGQTLTKAAQCYDGVISGMSDIGMSCLLYTRGRFPLMDFINLPFGNPSGEFATAIINEVYEKFKPKELSQVKVLYLHAHGPGFIHVKKKPIYKLEDLKGLKIRCPGSVADTLRALGATPVSMPMPEVYQALQKGVVQGAVYPMETNKGWKMAEVIDYSIANYEIAYSVGFFVVMNKKKWESLPEKYKKIIEEINIEWAKKHGKAWDKSDFEGFRFTLSQGNSIIGIGDEEAKRWKGKVKIVFDKYIQNTKKKNLPGEEIIKYLQKRLKEYNSGKFTSKYM